jgi:tetratricopeptide (TPR) repeat protein
MALITRVLQESLQMNRVDSPVRLTLDAQQKDPPAVQKALVAAENAIREKRSGDAIGHLSRAVALVPGNANIRVKLGLLLKDAGTWDEALAHFQQATEALPTYADAWRERGIAENKLYWKANRAPELPSGEASILQSIAMNPADFDALASLGGILKREGRLEEARDAYANSFKVSVANPYPLLNAIKLRANLAKRIELGPEEKAALVRVEPLLRGQTSNPSGAFNAPWSFFDLSEVRLYRGDDGQFLSILDKGLENCTAQWQPQTHRESLELLLNVDPMPVVLPTALEKCAMREHELIPPA